MGLSLIWNMAKTVSKLLCCWPKVARHKVHTPIALDPEIVLVLGELQCRLLFPSPWSPQCAC